MIFMIIKNFFQWLDFSSNDYVWINDRGEAQDPRSCLSSHVNHTLPSVNVTTLELPQSLVLCPCIALVFLLLLF